MVNWLSNTLNTILIKKQLMVLALILSGLNHSCTLDLQEGSDKSFKESDSKSSSSITKDIQALQTHFNQGAYIHEIVMDIDLPSIGPNGSAIEWSSNFPNIISNVGQVYRPGYFKDDAEVILTAIISQADKSEELEIPFTVLALKTFQSKWQTTKNNELVIVPTNGLGYYYAVDWGDGTPLQTAVTGDGYHVYEHPGTYKVQIGGEFPHIYFAANIDARSKILSVEQWGDVRWQSMQAAFWKCELLSIDAKDTPNLAEVVDLSQMFYGAKNLGMDENFTAWDTSTVTNFDQMFAEASSLSGHDLSGWEIQEGVSHANFSHNWGENNIEPNW